MLLRVFHITLAVILLVSTTGFSVFSHICKKRGVFVGIFHVPDSCCSKKKRETKVFSGKRNSAPLSINKIPCCKDAYSFFKAELQANDLNVEDKISSHDDIGFGHPFIFLEKTTLFANHKTLCFALYENPPPKVDIYIFVQSFLC